MQALHRLVPVEIDEPRIRVLPDGLGNQERRVAGAIRGLAADAILQWPADRRSQLERINSGIETGEFRVERLLQTRPDDFALRNALGDDDRLREIVVGQLHVQRQIETDRPLPDIETVVVDVRVVLQQRLEPLDFVLGRVNRRVLRQVEIDDQLRPVRGREELLLDEPVSIQ